MEKKISSSSSHKVPAAGKRQEGPSILHFFWGGFVGFVVGFIKFLVGFTMFPVGLRVFSVGLIVFSVGLIGYRSLEGTCLVGSPTTKLRSLVFQWIHVSRDFVTRWHPREFLSMVIQQAAFSFCEWGSFGGCWQMIQFVTGQVAADEVLSKRVW